MIYMTTWSGRIMSQFIAKTELVRDGRTYFMLLIIQHQLYRETNVHSSLVADREANASIRRANSCQ